MYITEYTFSSPEKQQLTLFPLNVTSHSVAYSSQTLLKVLNPDILGGRLPNYYIIINVYCICDCKIIMSVPLRNHSENCK